MKVKNDNFYLYENCVGEHGNNELVFGDVGQGKNLFMKQELLQFAVERMDNVKDHSQVLVIDSDGEFLSLAKPVHGSIVSVKSSGVDIFAKCAFVQEFEDFCSWSNKKNIAFDFAVALCEQACGKHLSGRTKSTINNIVWQMYTDTDPTMSVFYNKLVRLNDSLEINNVCECVKPLCLLGGKLKEHKENKFTVYDLHDFSKAYIGTAYVYCLLDIYKHMVENYQNGIKTYVYIDNISKLLSLDSSAYILSYIWIKGRMFNASFYGMCDDVNMLKTIYGNKIFMSTQNVRIFHSNSFDRNFLKNLLCFSDEQITLISQLHPGSGVLVRDGYVSLF